jgi:hypothetical protein
MNDQKTTFDINYPTHCIREFSKLQSLPIIYASTYEEAGVFKLGRVIDKVKAGNRDYITFASNTLITGEKIDLIKFWVPLQQLFIPYYHSMENSLSFRVIGYFFENYWFAYADMYRIKRLIKTLETD